MKRTHLAKFVAISGACLAAALAAPAVAVAEEDDVPSYREFKADTYVDSDGQYIVNGDEPAATDGLLRQFYDAMVKPPRAREDGLIINTVSGRDDRWSQTQVGNLTYCVSDRFGSQKAAVVSAMNQGQALWENASSAIGFVHLPAHDANCTVRNNAVLFSVEPTNTTQYIARAFFPSSSDRSRNVLVNASAMISSSWPEGNIMGHELGHALGFRHEHTRPEAGTCFENNSWRPLTPYDSASIMHYPQCNGTSRDLSFSAYDAQGVRAVYGS